MRSLHIIASTLHTAVQAGVVLLLFGVLLPLRPAARSEAISNLAWLHFVRFPARSVALDHAAEYFAIATRTSTANASAWRGTGMVCALQLDELCAFDAWQKGHTPSAFLTRTGGAVANQGLVDTAFIYYRGAGILDVMSPAEGDFAADRLCQIHAANTSALSATNRTYCEQWLERNDGNLLLDGQFAHETAWSWLSGALIGTMQGDASVIRDESTGFPAPSLALAGRSSGPHGGLYQVVALRPGSTVRFRAALRIDGSPTTRARVLHIQWRTAGKTVGNPGQVVEQSLEWTRFERTFTLPADAEPWAQFYPVILDGIGSVWIDDVRVELVYEP